MGARLNSIPSASPRKRRAALGSSGQGRSSCAGREIVKDLTIAARHPLAAPTTAS
jgi:hypothetical protein